MSDKTKTYATMLILGHEGFSSVRAVEDVQLFTKGSNKLEEGKLAPDVRKLLDAPLDSPLIMTPDGTMWKPACLADRLYQNLRAIGNIFGISPEVPVDEIYKKLAEYVDEQKKKDAAE